VLPAQAPLLNLLPILARDEDRVRGKHRLRVCEYPHSDIFSLLKLTTNFKSYLAGRSLGLHLTEDFARGVPAWELFPYSSGFYNGWPRRR
jgi:hypothetical protein